METPTRPDAAARKLTWIWLLGGLAAAGCLLLAMPDRPPVGGNDTPAPPNAPPEWQDVIPERRTPAVDSGLRDASGQPVAIACHVCHATRPANPQLRLASELARFHQGLHYRHGELTCASCHDPRSGYQSLRLADGRALPFSESMQLCAQCHGPQYRDYQQGAHGGMMGYWDRSRGPRYRQHCLDCHDPHAPKYPQVMPAPGPNDRFLNPHPHPGGKP